MVTVRMVFVKLILEYHGVLNVPVVQEIILHHDIVAF